MAKSPNARVAPRLWPVISTASAGIVLNFCRSWTKLFQPPRPRYSNPSAGIEYCSSKGRSAPSRPVYTRLAVPVTEDAAPPATDMAGKVSPRATATPFFSAPVRPGRSLLVGRGQLDAKVDIGYDTERMVSDGWGYVNNAQTHTGTMPFWVEDWETYDSAKLYYWELTTSRSIISVPLTVRYGLLDSLELGATGAWHSESAIYERATVDGNDYDRTIAIPEMHTSGIADTTLFAHLQPVIRWPFLLSAEVTLPTGSSRFSAYATN